MATRGFNKVILMGNLTRDPEMRYTANQFPIARFSVAVNHTRKDKNGEIVEEVDFIPVSVLGKQAENCERFLKKGRTVLVEGRLSIRSYEAKTGEKKSWTEVVADNVQFIGGRRDDEASDGGASYPSRPSQRPISPQQDDGPKSFRDEYPPFEDEQSDGGKEDKNGNPDEFPMDISKLPASSKDDEADIPF